MDRRGFLCGFVGVAGAGAGLAPAVAAQAVPGRYVVGPQEGYSPQLGALVSMLAYTRGVVLQSVASLSRGDLDHLHDANANSIGALLLHLAATEVWYQANTFDGRLGFNADEEARWGAGMVLGARGRTTIRGHELRFYLDALAEVRARTLSEFRSRDDAWLARLDPRSPMGEPTNTHWKWFHVCEHESHHNGQISFLRSRLPGAGRG